CLEIDYRPALLGGGGAGVADRPGGIEVLRLPAELGKAVGTKVLELLQEGELARAEILRLLHADEVRPQMQHDRGFDIAVVDSVERLFRRGDAFGMAEARPCGADAEHLVAHAQLAGDDIDHGYVAAVRIDDDELPDARTPDAVADVEPEAGRAFPGSGQGA